MPEFQPRAQEHNLDPYERQRLENLMEYEKAARLKGYRIIAGIDEAGRGPLAGPVVAAACILPENFLIPGVDDSKKLTPKKRFEIYERIISDDRIDYGIGVISSIEIDRINILQATIQAMLQALRNLKNQPDILLVDGLKLPHTSIPCEKIIGGDGKSQSIAAASIIAKETRDRIMFELDAKFPQYGFAQHKGYGTAQHLEALTSHGPCEIHRFSFEPVKSGARRQEFRQPRNSASV